MPKLKTKKAVKKRFKITGTGKIMRKMTKKRHLLVDRPQGKKRAFRKDVQVDKTDVKRVTYNLPYGD